MSETTLPPTELLPPGCGPDDDRWHEMRRVGVTASEIAAVMGISPWESPFSLYWRKVNDWRWEGNEFTSVGRHLEDAIADWWQRTHSPDHPVLHAAGLYASAERPWQLATPDRLMCDPQMHDNPFPGDPTFKYEHPVTNVMGLLECKWVAYSWDGWGEPGTDEIPVYYRAQCLWQLDVMGVDEVHVAALGPGGFRSYLVRRDEDDLKLMREAGEAFYQRLFDEDPPDLDSHSSTLGALKRLHPSVGEGDVECTPDLAFEYATAREVRKDAEATIAACEALIRDKLGSTYARVVHDGRLVASRSVFEVERIDVARLRKERPEIAAEYLTKTVTDRLNPPRSKRDA